MPKIHKDMGHMLERVEKMEKRLDNHIQIIRELKEEMEALNNGKRELAYKLEDQENRNRRKNLRIRGLPESIQGQDLMGKIQTIFNPVIGREANPIKFERVHRIRKTKGILMETPRDVIVRFQNFGEKNLIWGNMRGKP